MKKTFILFVAGFAFFDIALPMKRGRDFLGEKQTYPQNKKKKTVNQGSNEYGAQLDQLEKQVELESSKKEENSKKYKDIIKKLDVSLSLQKNLFNDQNEKELKKYLLTNYDSYLLNLIVVPTKSFFSFDLQLKNPTVLSSFAPKGLKKKSPVTLENLQELRKDQEKNKKELNHIVNKKKSRDRTYNKILFIVKNQPLLVISNGVSVEVYKCNGEKLLTCDDACLSGEFSELQASKSLFLYDCSQENKVSFLDYTLLPIKNRVSIVYSSVTHASIIKSKHQVTDTLILPGENLDTIVLLADQSVSLWKLPHLRYLTSKQLALIIKLQKLKNSGSKPVNLNQDWQKVFDSLNKEIQKELANIIEKNETSNLYCNIM